MVHVFVFNHMFWLDMNEEKNTFILVNLKKILALYNIMMRFCIFFYPTLVGKKETGCQNYKHNG